VNDLKISQQQKHFFKARKTDGSRNSTFEHISALSLLSTCASMSKPPCALLLGGMDEKLFNDGEESLVCCLRYARCYYVAWMESF
jgi:hypothetical protein